ncbi:aldo/keto reductase [Flavobacterium sp.]|uniref:aldo/keto reductase n=1 Tax=Flavobacterium sp. TaxID=239 RepID=UPI00404894DA
MTKNLSKLVLGTVQMGLNYGINNDHGKISIKQCHQILLRAHLSGIITLDTAEAYGNAHHVIGEFHRHNPNHKFNIVTKVPHEIEAKYIEIKVKKYLEDLAVNCIETVMFHSFDSFKSNKAILDKLLELKSKRLINNLGVSVYTNDQLEYLIDKDDITIVQLPFNLLDNYSIRGNLLELLKLKGKIIHTRSAFLQGLFFKKTIDENKIVQKLQYELEILNQLVSQYDCSMEELAISYCLKQKNIDNVIIGVDSIDHLNANIKASSYNIHEVLMKKINSIKIKDVDLLNPSLW